MNDKSYRCDDYEIRPLLITQGDSQRSVLLYHLLHWPDHDIPNDETSIFELLSKLYKDRDSSINLPILIHCRFVKSNTSFSYEDISFFFASSSLWYLSAGCGRTGTLIAIDLCRLLLNDEVVKKKEKIK